ncbi:MAG: type II secretion system ATPase GspE [Candidatus Omnitrophica bacterium]|nr:type II secretion system ATPase GspE [Candidatus Omnitrophota bacterium]
MARKIKKSLGDSLVDEGIITKEQLTAARREEKKTGLRLRTILVNMGLLTEEDLVLFLSNKLGMPRIELGNYIIDPKILELVPEQLARKHQLVPVLKIGNRLTCAMVDPWNVFALDEIRMKTNLILEPSVATETEINRALNEHYGAKGSMEDIIKSIEDEQPEKGDAGGMSFKSLEGMAEEPAVVKLVNMIIMKAAKEGSSDIHIEPEEMALKTRFRVDGMLHEEAAPPKHLQSAIISRIKIMANLDISERRVPQDGRFDVNIAGKKIDIRVSTVPTIYGENIVMRLLDVSSTLLTLKDMGFTKDILVNYEKLIKRPHGIVLVTGPTGSGKTTTLYASLDKINTVEKNIITIEDPVEYRLAGVRQIQVNAKVDLTFANGLRSILRQDPDVIMVGEIRDHETAEIAIHAALTGHLVFSTLHTNDAPGAVARLIDMGTEPFLVSSSIAGVLAQRLVRKICPNCKTEHTPTKEALKDVGFDGNEKIKFYSGKGCSKCSNLGYKGRIGIFELLLLDDKIRNLIIAKAPVDEIRNAARASGMHTLLENGMDKIREGATTVEEVLRVTQEE